MLTHIFLYKQIAMTWKKNVFIVRPLHKEYILRVYIIFPYNFEIHPPVFLHCPWGWSWAQSCSSQFLGRKKGAIFSRSAGKPWIFLGFPACGWNSMAFIMLPGKKCSLDPWSVKDDLRKLLFFASESIKTHCDTTGGPNQCPPRHSPAPWEGWGNTSLSFCSTKSWQEVFFVFLFHVFMFCDKKYDLKSDSLSNLTILFQSTL